ncbi:putative leucine-rich repeat-containing protein DDB_G0290503 [Centruroides vittatus]|uniref:putative leucine-rich repeat-containing protein DDB_G0290503 n=1 Tax=Centruroides vittatus TaxID=120091 RepID=UPI0035102602
MDTSSKKKIKHNSYKFTYFLKKFCCSRSTRATSQQSMNVDNASNSFECIPVRKTWTIKPEMMRRTRSQSSIQNKTNCSLNTSCFKINHINKSNKNVNFVRDLRNNPISSHKKYPIYKQNNLKVADESRSKNNSPNRKLPHIEYLDLKNFDIQTMDTNSVESHIPSFDCLMKNKKKHQKVKSIRQSFENFSEIPFAFDDSNEETSKNNKHNVYHAFDNKSNAKIRKKLWKDLYKTLRKLFVLEETTSQISDDIKKEMLTLLVKSTNNEVLGREKVNISTESKTLSKNKVRRHDSLKDDNFMTKNVSLSFENANSEEESNNDQLSENWIEQHADDNIKAEQKKSQANIKKSEEKIKRKKNQNVNTKLNESFDENYYLKNDLNKKLLKMGGVRESREDKKHQKDIDKKFAKEIYRKPQREKMSQSEKSYFTESDTRKQGITKDDFDKNATKMYKSSQIEKIPASGRNNKYEFDVNKKKATHEKLTKYFQEIEISPIDPPQSYTIDGNILTVNKETIPSNFRIKQKKLSSLNLKLKQREINGDQKFTKIDVFQIPLNETVHPGQSIKDIVQSTSEKNAKIIIISPDKSDDISPSKRESPITILPSKFDNDRENEILQKSSISGLNKNPILIPMKSQFDAKESKTRPTIVAVSATDTSKPAKLKDKSLTVIILPAPFELQQQQTSEGIIDEKWSNLVQDLGSSLPPSVYKKPMFILVPKDSEYASKKIVLEDPKGSKNRPIVFVPSIEHFPQQQIIKEEPVENFSNIDDQLPTLIVLPSKSEHILIKIDNTPIESCNVATVEPDRTETKIEEKAIVNETPLKHEITNDYKSPQIQKDKSDQSCIEKSMQYRLLQISNKSHKITKKISHKSSKLNPAYLILQTPNRSICDSSKKLENLSIQYSGSQQLSIESKFSISKKSKDPQNAQLTLELFDENEEDKQHSQTETEIPMKESKFSKTNTPKKSSQGNRSQEFDNRKGLEENKLKKGDLKTYGQILQERMEARFLEEHRKNDDDFYTIVDSLMVALHERTDK